MVVCAKALDISLFLIRGRSFSRRCDALRQSELAEEQVADLTFFPEREAATQRLSIEAALFCEKVSIFLSNLLEFGFRVELPSSVE